MRLPDGRDATQPTFSGVQDGGSLAGKDSCDSSVTLSPCAVWSRPLASDDDCELVGTPEADPPETAIRRAWAPCSLGNRSVRTPFSMRASAFSELTGVGSVTV